jgi:hypothetical protein
VIMRSLKSRRDCPISGVTAVDISSGRWGGCLPGLTRPSIRRHHTKAMERTVLLACVGSTLRRVTDAAAAVTDV